MRENLLFMEVGRAQSSARLAQLLRTQRTEM